jgi:signal transduction histidine kinase
VYDEDYDTGAASSRWADEPDESADEGVLPLAEALLRGERVETKHANGHTSPPHPHHPNGNSAAHREPLDDAAPVERKVEPFRVLLVDDRDKFRTTMLLKLARSGHRVFPVTKPREAVDVFSRENTDLVLIRRDALLEVGAEFVRRIRATAPHTPILVHGGKANAGDVGSLKHGVDITVVASAGEDADLLAEMIDCSLAASRAIRRVRDDQVVRGKILSELCYNLRSSLDVISGYTDILSDEPDLSKFRDMLDRMRASTTAATVHMQSAVDVALDVPDNVRKERFDLSTLSEKIERLVTRQIGNHPLRLTTSGPVKGAALFTDGEKLLSILSHVITDAIKFTPTGEINVAVRSLQDHTDFIVTDAGPGISADVPMPFPAAPPPGGEGATSGVGLAIAERLSRSIGATLTGTCGEGGSAAFTISVPSKLMTPTTEQVSRTLH